MIGWIIVVWYVYFGVVAVNLNVVEIAVEREVGQSVVLLVISKVLTWPFWAFK